MKSAKDSKEAWRHACYAKLQIAPLVLFAFSFVTTTATAQTDNGRDIYEAKCRLCHGLEGNGTLLGGGTLRTRIQDRSYEFSLFLSRVLNGYRNMPPRRDVDPSQLLEIYRYLEGNGWETASLDSQTRQSTPSQQLAECGPHIAQYAQQNLRDMPERLRSAELERLRKGCETYRQACQSCHGIDALGGHVTRSQLVQGFATANRPSLSPRAQRRDGRSTSAVDPYRSLIGPPILGMQQGGRGQRHARSVLYAYSNRMGSPDELERDIIGYLGTLRPAGAQLYEAYCHRCHDRTGSPAPRLRGAVTPNYRQFFSKSICGLGAPSELRAPGHPCCSDESNPSCRQGYATLFGYTSVTGHCRWQWTVADCVTGDHHLRALHAYLCNSTHPTCAERVASAFQIAAQQRREAAIAQARENAQRARDAERHAYYLALTSSRCKSNADLERDGLRRIGRVIKKNCRTGNLRSSTATRTTLAEARNPNDKPHDRDSTRNGEFGRGTIGEVPRESGYVDLAIDEERCVVPELFIRGPTIDWTCGNGVFGRSDTIHCPDGANFIRIVRSRTEVRFECYAGDWVSFLSDLRLR